MHLCLDVACRLFSSILGITNRRLEKGILANRTHKRDQSLAETSVPCYGQTIFADAVPAGTPRLGVRPPPSLASAGSVNAMSCVPTVDGRVVSSEPIPIVSHVDPKGAEGVGLQTASSPPAGGAVPSRWSLDVGTGHAITVDAALVSSVAEAANLLALFTPLVRGGRTVRELPPVDAISRKHTSKAQYTPI